MKSIDNFHDKMVSEIKPALAYNESCNYADWKKKLQRCFYKLFGFEQIKKNGVVNNIEIEYEKEYDKYLEIKYSFESEKGLMIPCYLLTPKIKKEKFPVAICLQGHSTGLHNSVGKPKFEEDKGYIESRGDFGIQAVNNGYAALCIELRGMGELKPELSTRYPHRGCDFYAYNALISGRTLIGERVWDVSKAIDTLKYFDKTDDSKIICLGNSGGGTTSFYAACYDERIKIAVPSCSVCSYRDSIASVYHCSCNYVPYSFMHFDMGELACLIAPRNLVIVAGIKDEIFPIEGVKSVFSIIEKVYNKENAIKKCKLVITPDGHWWRKDLIWDTVNEIANELNWVMP